MQNLVSVSDLKKKRVLRHVTLNTSGYQEAYPVEQRAAAPPLYDLPDFLNSFPLPVCCCTPSLGF